MSEQEKLEKAIEELAKRTLMEKGATEQQAIELVGGTAKATELFVKSIMFSEKKIEYEMLKEITKKIISEDKQVSETRVMAMVQMYFLTQNKNPLEQLNFADKLIEIAQAQIIGRNIKEEIHHRIKEAKEFAKMF